MTARLENQRALVVGASRGIGQRTAELFVEEGARVAFASRSVDRLDALTAEEPSAIAVECDLTDTTSVRSAVDAAVEAFDGLDVVVNSAGAITRGPITETDDDAIEHVLDVNLAGTMRLAREAMPALVASNGSFVTVSSEAADRGVPSLPAYSASKGGVNALTRQLAIEYAGDVTVNAVAPGTTKTELNAEVRRTDPTWVDERQDAIPAGRLAEPEDVAQAALYLVSAGDYVTGQVLRVDGGATVA